MCHVRLDQVACRESTAERKLTGQDGGTNDSGQATGVLSGGRGMGSSDTKHVEHSALGLKDGASTEGTNFERGHGDGDLERSTEANLWLAKLVLGKG